MKTNIANRVTTCYMYMVVYDICLYLIGASILYVYDIRMPWLLQTVIIPVTIPGIITFVK